MANEFSIKSLNCPSCGAKLDVTNRTTDIVFCSSCGTKCVISGLNTNEELLKKNNINSGLPLVESSVMIQRSIFEFLTLSDCFPIDVLERFEITGLRMVSVPAYLFTVSAFASYSYEAGNERKQSNVVTSANGRVATRTSTYTEWTQMSSVANDTRTLIVCGNKRYMNVINRFYETMSPGRLVDIEYLDYPEGTETESFDVPYASAFNQYLKPAVNKCVSASALGALQGRTYRNFSIGQANIQKEYEARVSLGIYIVDCAYDNQKITFYFNSDASDFLTNVKPPVDTARISYANRLQQDKNSIKSTFTYDLFHGGYSRAKENKAAQKEEGIRLQQQIDSVLSEPTRAKNNFINNGCCLKGIYSNGNDSFEWRYNHPQIANEEAHFESII